MNKVELFLLNHMEVEFEYCQSTKQGILYLFDNLLNEFKVFEIVKTKTRFWGSKRAVHCIRFDMELRTSKIQR